MNTPKVGIFAGTFDPIHEGHIAFAGAALAEGLKKIMFLPEPRPRRKQAVRALEHRTAMVQLATSDNPRFGTIILEQARFTPHETLPLLKARFPGHKLVLLFGDDVVSHIASWPHVDDLVSSVELMIASRQQNTDALIATINTLQNTRNLKFKYKIVYPDRQDVASSTIRLQLKRNQATVGLPISVENYIHKNRIYTSPPVSK